MLFCLFFSVFGAAFQVGWNIGIFNTPIEVIKRFFNDIYIHRYSEPISEATFDTLWSITNGLLPLGAAIGGLSSGFAADYFGRFIYSFKINHLFQNDKYLLILFSKEKMD